jgi:hypothetical protein
MVTCEKKIGWLDVTMHDSPVVCMKERLADLAGKRREFFLGKHAMV